MFPGSSLTHYSHPDGVGEWSKPSCPYLWSVNDVFGWKTMHVNGSQRMPVQEYFRRMAIANDRGCLTHATLNGSIRYGRINELADIVLDTLRVMREKDIQPDPDTYYELLLFYTARHLNCSSHNVKQEIHATVLGVCAVEPPSLELLSTALRCCFLIQQMGLCHNIVYHMQQKGVYDPEGCAWFSTVEKLGQPREEQAESRRKITVRPLLDHNIRIRDLGKQSPQAVQLIESELTRIVEEGLQPDIFTYVPYVRSLLRENLRERVITLFQEMREKGVPPDASIYTQLLCYEQENRVIDSSVFDVCQKIVSGELVADGVLCSKILEILAQNLNSENEWNSLYFAHYIFRQGELGLISDCLRLCSPLLCFFLTVPDERNAFRVLQATQFYWPLREEHAQIFKEKFHRLNLSQKQLSAIQDSDLKQGVEALVQLVGLRRHYVEVEDDTQPQ